MTNEHAQKLGKLGGKASVKSRFNGLSKNEISEIMRNVRVKDLSGHINIDIFKRTFEAKKFPVGSDERKKLNEDGITSEYMTSYKYMVKTNVSEYTFKTFKEALAHFE